LISVLNLILKLLDQASILSMLMLQLTNQVCISASKSVALIISLT
jgi:hypothetical protein